MRLDQGSLIFTPKNGECPSWETSLGQSHEGNGNLPPYHFKAEGYENLLKGMFFNSIPLAEVSCILGKQKFFVTASESYKSSQNQEIQLASRFDTIIVRCGNEVKTFRDIPIILLFTKIQDENKFHFGRRSIKYSPHTSFGLSTKNSDSFERIQKHFNTRLTCYGLFVEHFDTLNFYCVDADANYDKEQWKNLKLPETEWTDWASWEIKEREKYDFQKYLEFPIFDESFVHGLNNEQIIQKMATILRQEWVENGYPGVHYFGFKYSKVLKQIKASPAEIIKWANEHNTDNRIPTTYNGEISKTIKVFECAEKDNEVNIVCHDASAVKEISTNQIETNSSVSENIQPTLPLPDFTPSQTIYYGVPGCGKSYEVNKVINAELDKYGVTDKEYHKVRCVFHPEYCNADLVGQIYPYVKPDNGGVEYRFKPGPFAEIVRRAYRNPAEPFFLVIEEINRGNAAAIFGEMFQLLDRIRPEDGPEELSGNIYNTGWSSYGVTNIDVNAYVRQKSTDNPEKIEYDDSIPYGDKIKFINNTAVRLPPNLSIYATMNTNDQNVFTMDNAFQRRFKSKMIRNVLDENSAQYKTEIDDTGVCWGNFREWINEKILLPQTAVLKADDKCLGGWFITGEKIGGADKIKKEDFAEKVLKYLWDDVFKRNKSGEIFVKDDKVNSLSDLIDAFEMSVGFESFEKIFKMNDVDKAKLQKQANT